jgi:tetratricopeptide (TPR) repeat protein
MPSIRSARLALSLALAATPALWPRTAHAQRSTPAAMPATTPASDAYLRAQDFEDHDQYEEAAKAYREAIAQSPASIPAILGLERVYALLGRSDSLLPILDTAIARQPRATPLRAAQLRTLRSLGDRDRLRAAFDAWRHDVPRDPAPYREYARMLIQDGLTATADTVLRQAQADIGSGRGFEYELAQLHAAMGLWENAAQSWRQAVADNVYLDQAAIFSLLPTPLETRDAVRRALAAPPPSVTPLKVLAALDVAWGAPRAGWDALRNLRPDSAVLATWLDFSRRAEEAQAWLAARDALVAVHAVRPSPELIARAAADALSGGDAASAVALATRAERTADSSVAAFSVVPIHLRALSALGKPEDGERVLGAYERFLQPDQRDRYTQLLAWGWVRIGNLDKAKAMLAASGGGNDAAEGWLALYGGDLATARKRLRSTSDAQPELITALELLQRTKADSAPEAGRAFLTLARGDTLEAATSFEQAATALPEAGSLLLAMAARLHAAQHGDAKAIADWKSIVETSPTAPEAPEAELEWARALRRGGNTAGAVARLEHLILTYPESALVPQARRELELARRAVPETS